ncbi:MAG: hypothetical protein ABIO76_07955 [Ginsengibacter sp.]
MSIKIKIIFIVSVFAMAAPTLKLMAQNVTSPYSILGIGDVDTHDFGRYFATGNASVSRRDASSYNFSNPASLTSLPFKTVNFDIAMRGRFSRFSNPGSDTSTGITKDFVVKRISLAFKTGEKTAFAFGLKPYSSVNYQYSVDKTILDGNTKYTKSIDGSGSINQAYFSLGRSIGKRFSAGITASWLFGSLSRVTQYAGNTLDFPVEQDVTDFYNGGNFLAGFQYFSLPNKKWQHLLGVTLSAGTNLSGNFTTDYKENDTTRKTNVIYGQQFKMPSTISLGYTATYKRELILSVEGNYYNWPYQKINYSNSYTNPSIRLSFGMEYSSKVWGLNTYNERYYVGWGVSAENSYMRLENNYLWDYSLSFGGGYNLSRSLSFYGGFESGSKGNKSQDQIKEIYTQLVIGFTLKDIWIGPKFKKFN